MANVEGQPRNTHTREFRSPLLQPTENLKYPFEVKPLFPIDIEYPLQKRIVEEWHPILGDDASPISRLDFFKQRADKFINLASVSQNSKIDSESGNNVNKNGIYLKISALDLAASLHLDINSFVQVKILDKIDKKYPPYEFTRRRLAGQPIPDIRRELKELFESGYNAPLLRFEIPIEEQKAMKPRDIPFEDPHQDVIDTWQRRAFGSDLNVEDRVPVVIEEVGEVLAEFEGLDNDQIHSIKDIKHLLRIGEELADVIIALDGFFSAKDVDVEPLQEKYLDRMIDKYKSVKRLKRAGLSTEEAMAYLNSAMHRAENGLAMPPSPVPGFTPIFNISEQ